MCKWHNLQTEGTLIKQFFLLDLASFSQVYHYFVWSVSDSFLFCYCFILLQCSFNPRFWNVKFFHQWFCSFFCCSNLPPSQGGRYTGFGSGPVATSNSSSGNLCDAVCYIGLRVILHVYYIALLWWTSFIV